MDLFDFAAVAKGLDIKNKLKLILFASGVKPNTFVILRINPKSLEEKHQFEKLLKENRTIYHAGRPKSYEVIKEIKGSKVVWKIAGAWIGYDLFKDKKSEEDFQKYIDLLVRFKHKEADKVAGRLYGYPDCCTKQFIKEHDAKYLKRKYTCYEYYKKFHDTDRKFPWAFHQPHAVDCEASQKLNRIYSRTVKEAKEKVWQEYDKKRSFKTEFIVDGYSDVKSNGKTIWPEKDGYEYSLITRKPLDGKYWLISYLSKQKYEKGTLLEGEAVFRHDYANVLVRKVKKKKIEGLHHERHLPLLGRKF